MNKSAKLDAGTIVAGRYRVEREIGRGGMAQVYEARHTDIGKGVAVKVLAAEFASSPVVVERFLREARAAAAVHSPYICDVHDSGKLEDGRPFLVMELLRGESLYERMVRVRQFDVETTARIVAQVARGLMKAHAAGIVHRDLKPENIFLTTNEEGEIHAKLLDFGLAKFYEQTNDGGAQARLTREGAIFGTPAYMSPEQVQGQGTVDHRADLWALGCIAYECLTGRTVWSTDKGIAMTFAQIASAPLPKLLRYRPDLPASMEPWYEKALAREPNERFQSAKELAEGLAQAIDANASSWLFSSEISRVGPSPLTPEMRQQLGQQLGVEGPMSPRPAAGVPAPGSLPGVGPDTLETPPPSARTGRVASVPLGQVSVPVGMPSTQTSQDLLGRQESLAGETSSAPKPTTEKPGARWPLVLVALMGVVGGGVGAWWQFLRPGVKGVTPPTSAQVPSSSSGVVASASSSAPPVSDPTGGPKWVAVVQEGQAKLLAGDYAEASKRFKEAQDTLSSPVGKAMYEHVAVARENKGTCRLSALTRLRGPSVASQSTGAPSLVATPRGLLALWVDDHETVGRDHIYAQLLDRSTLKPEGKPVDVTPEADRVTRFAVAMQGERVALLYAARSVQQGVFLRWLDADASVAAAAVQVGSAKDAQATLALAADGEAVWGVWDEKGDGDRSDLMVAKLSATPPAAAVRVTDLKPGRFKPRIGAANAAAGGGALEIVFRADRDAARPVSLLHIMGSDPGLNAGLPAVAGVPKEDRVVGKLVALSTPRDKADAPDVICAKDSCFAAWHLEAAGTTPAFSIAQVTQKGEVPWSKRYSLSAYGGRPSLAMNGEGEALVVWFEKNRIQVAPLTGREGLGVKSQVAHTSNDRTSASVVGLGPREWAVGWLDFEKAKLEPYVMRVSCR